MERPSLIDETGPRHRVETWMALVLTLSCPLVYWTMYEHRALRTLSFALLIAIVVLTITMAWVEQRRAKEQPKRYRRGMAWTLAVFGCIHLSIVGVGFVCGAFTPIISLVDDTDGGTISRLPETHFAISECRF